MGGIKTAVEFAQKVNEQAGSRQVTILDIGGGLGVDYMSETCPDHVAYAADLRAAIPGLLKQKAGDDALFDKVITEFGQSLNAKGGFIASRMEYVKATADDVAQIAVCHFGADMCPRQCYTQDHKRRVEFYDGQTCTPLREARALIEADEPLPKGDNVTTHVAGPLCFQGDFITKNASAPTLRVDDFVVMRDTGANCLSLFSRHCSRFAPVVLGYRLHADGSSVDMQTLKAAESLESLVGFWGGSVPMSLAAELGGAKKRKALTLVVQTNSLTTQEDLEKGGSTPSPFFPEQESFALTSRRSNGKVLVLAIVVVLFFFFF